MCVPFLRENISELSLVVIILLLTPYMHHQIFVIEKRLLFRVVCRRRTVALVPDSVGLLCNSLIHTI